MSSTTVAKTKHPSRITFLSPMCALDVVSGAALDVRGMLETLAAAGHSVQSYTASLFDANTEVEYSPYLGKEAANREVRGKVARIRANNVLHNVFITDSSQGRKLKQQEAQAITVAWRSVLRNFKPQIVITFGTSAVSLKMQDDARKAGVQLIFFLANADIDAAKVVRPGERVVTPSHFLAERYSPFADSPPQVLRSIIDSSRFLTPDLRLLTNARGMQRAGLVTFMNPIPHKGLTLFTRIAQRALAEQSDMTFAVLEGRMSKALVRRLGIDLPSFQNVWWLPAQQNMRAVYARTSILLAPSFCQEGLARCVLEAHLSATPVLASGRGGLPEAFPGVRKPLPIPERCIANMNAYPDDETVDVWWNELSTLWNDDDAYMQAVQDAGGNAVAFAPERTRAAVRDFFEQIASTLQTP